MTVVEVRANRARTTDAEMSGVTISRLADLSVPEFRRIALTWLLTAVVVGLFLWMVREVLIAAVLGIVIASYLRPLYRWIQRKPGKPHGGAPSSRCSS